MACSVVLSVGIFVTSVGVDGASASGASKATSHKRAHQNAIGQTAFQWEIAASARATNAGTAVPKRGRARCYLKTLRAVSGPRPATRCVANEVAGYTACNIQKAYKLTKLSAADGVGETVGVVDAYDDPNAEADLGVYRSTNELPPCTTDNGCFEKVNQEGVSGDPPSGDMSWGGEISLDLDMVSAVCPNCHIILVKANSNGIGDLIFSVGEAVSLGANVVADSWGMGEFDGETGMDEDLDFPGVPITFSSGDGAYQGGVQYPSASPNVTSVGGTMIAPTTTGRKWTETAWVVKPSKGQQAIEGSGSGCSAWEAKPAWQADSGCSTRMTADVSAVAADVQTYDTYQSDGGGTYVDFGTSVSSPIIAAIYALAANTSSVPVAASAACTNTYTYSTTSPRGQRASAPPNTSARPRWDTTDLPVSEVPTATADSEAGQLLDPHVAGSVAETARSRTAEVVSALSQNDMSGPSMLPGWDRRTIACHLRYGARASLRVTNEDGLSGLATSFYPQGRSSQRPGTLVPDLGETAAEVVASLGEEHTPGRNLVAAHPLDWSTVIEEPPASHDLGRTTISSLLCCG